MEQSDSASPEAEPRQEPLRAGPLLALALLFVGAAHLPELAGGFIWDDRVLIEAMGTEPSLSPLEHLDTRFFGETPEAGASAYYRPLTSLSFAIDASVWGMQPFGFHLTNWLLHLACTALVFGLCLRMGAHPLGSAFAAALFGVAPRLTESVGWISGRTDLIATLGALGALALHRSEPRALLDRIAAAAVLFLGILGKEVAIAGAASLVALECARLTGRSSAHRALLNLAPMAGALLVYGALRMGAPDAASSAPPFSFPDRLLLGLETLGTYVLLLADPLRPRLQIGLLDTGLTWRALIGMGAALGVVVGGVQIARRRSGLELAALALGFTALLPVLHVLPLPVKVVAADRFLYLPLAALVVLCASLSRGLNLRATPRTALIAGGALAAFFASTAWRAADWADEVALWQKATHRSHPLNSRPHVMLGEALLRNGQPERALGVLQRAHRIDLAYSRERPWADDSGTILGNRAAALAALGRHGEATEILIQLSEREPERPQHQYNLGVLYARQQRINPALRALERAQRLAGHYPAAAELHAVLSKER